MTGPRALGRLAAIWRFPTKSLRAQPLHSVAIGPEGLDGDRRRALILETPERARSGKPYRGKEHNLLHTVDEPAAAQTLAAQRGLTLGLHDDGPYFDAQPVSLIVDSWIRDLERMVGMPLDPLRFRPNLYVAASGPAEPEQSYIGKAIEAGGVRLRVVATILRCVTPTYDVGTGEPAPDVLVTLVQQRANVMGIYCSVEWPGCVALGDDVTAFDGPPVPSPA